MYFPPCSSLCLSTVLWKLGSVASWFGSVFRVWRPSLSLSHVLVCACFYGQYPTALIGAGKRSEAAPPPTPMELENPPIPLIRRDAEITQLLREKYTLLSPWSPRSNQGRHSGMLPDKQSQGQIGQHHRFRVTFHGAGFALKEVIGGIARS